MKERCCYCNEDVVWHEDGTVECLKCGEVWYDHDDLADMNRRQQESDIIRYEQMIEGYDD